VTESAEKSGTLITARLALDFGRDVFAIPGDITKATSIGTNSLIRDGQAKLTMNASDILSEYGPVTILTQREILPNLPTFDDPIEASIYELLTTESFDISSLSDRL
jgi:DNA processing protein